MFFFPYKKKIIIILHASRDSTDSLIALIAPVTTPFRTAAEATKGPEKYDDNSLAPPVFTILVYFHVVWPSYAGFSRSAISALSLVLDVDTQVPCPNVEDVVAKKLPSWPLNSVISIERPSIPFHPRDFSPNTKESKTEITAQLTLFFFFIYRLNQYY